MTRVQLRWFVLAIVLLNTVQCELCDFADIPCMTKAADNVLKAVNAGVEGVVEPGDPLFAEKIVGSFEAMKYDLTNATLSGMSSCKVTELICNKDESVFTYKLGCDQLVLNTIYQANGNLGTLEINGNGEATVIFDDYLIIIHGKYGKKISEKDGKPHIFIVHGISIDTEPKGKVTFKNIDLFTGDKTKIDKGIDFLNENAIQMEKQLRPIMEAFMTKHLERVDAFLGANSLEKVIPKL